MPNKYFDITKPGPQRGKAHIDVEKHFVSKYLLAHYQNVNHLEENLKRLPEPEEFFFLQTGNSFNAFTFIPLVCKHINVRRLYASTYSISRRVIEALIELHTAGKIEEITLLICDSMIKRNPTTIDSLLSTVSSYGNIKVLFGWNHSKVCLMQAPQPPKGGAQCNYFVIEGSGNWAENAQMEQYTFANSKGLFDFRMDLFAPERARQVAEGGALRAVQGLEFKV
jgi:hypothetical protein